MTFASFLRPEPSSSGETYDDFVHRIIDLKKVIVAQAIGASAELQKAHRMIYDSGRPIRAKDVFARGVTFWSAR
jgi:hypothetical protein